MDACLYSLSSGRAPEARRQHAGRGPDAAAPPGMAVVRAAAPPGRSVVRAAAPPGRSVVDAAAPGVRPAVVAAAPDVVPGLAPARPALRLCALSSSSSYLAPARPAPDLYLPSGRAAATSCGPVGSCGCVDDGPARPCGCPDDGPARPCGCPDDGHARPCGCVRTPACVLAARLIHASYTPHACFNPGLRAVVPRGNPTTHTHLPRIKPGLRAHSSSAPRARRSTKYRSSNVISTSLLLTYRSLFCRVLVPSWALHLASSLVILRYFVVLFIWPPIYSIGGVGWCRKEGAVSAEHAGAAADVV
jgi:hypothetical protein